jgi:hypothetical protein
MKLIAFFSLEPDMKMTELSEFVSVCEFPKMDYEEVLAQLNRKEWPLLEKTLRETKVDIQPYLQDYVNAFQRRRAADLAYDSFHFDPTDEETRSDNWDRMNALRIQAAQAKWYEDWTYRTLRHLMLGEDYIHAD